MGLPDPTIILGVDNLPVDNPKFDQFLPSSKVFGFKQMIPSYALRKARSGKQQNISIKQKLIAEYVKANLKAYLITALVELEKVKKLEQYSKRQLKLYKSLEDYFKGKLEAGNAIYGRFSEVDVERVEVEQELNNLRSERVAIEAELVRLVDEVPDIVISDVPAMQWNYDLGQVYPVRIMEGNIKVASSGVEIAEKSYQPNYDIQALYKQREEGESFSGDDWFSLQTSISIPLWYHSNQKPKLHAARLVKQKTEFSLDDTRRSWQKQLTVIASQRDTCFANIKLLQNKYKAIKSLVSSIQRNYEAGSAELESVLDAQINELNIAASLVKQESQFLKLSASFNSHIIPR